MPMKYANNLAASNANARVLALVAVQCIKRQFNSLRQLNDNQRNANLRECG